jgi:hypothetical protein
MKIVEKKTAEQSKSQSFLYRVRDQVGLKKLNENMFFFKSEGSI